MDTRRLRNLRRRVWERDQGACWICQEPVPLEVMTLDHQVPRSKGGRATFDNLRAAHEICNRERGDHPERTGKRNPTLPTETKSKRKRKKNKKHRDPMTVTILDRLAEEHVMSRLADGRPASVKTVDGRVVWVEK